ncbi:MAG TPA: RNA degradosome polyphosphate kinase [Actinomycetes bacterium]|nr:RNA degradosome polyphosphate kinase [Actinomycetes bacterium]
MAAEVTPDVPDDLTSRPLPPDRFADRELSWLAFNQRVLELAEDETVPPLERARFLAIFASNLDEFYMVRVAGLKRRIAAGIAVRAASGLTPRELMKRVHERTAALQARHAQCYRDLAPILAAEGIQIVRWRDLDDDEQKSLSQLFDDQVFAVLTPLAVDPAHPFPYISGLSLNLAVVVRNPTTGQEHFARVKVPPTLPRFVPTDSGERFVPLEDVIAAHLDRLFPGMEILQRHTFRVTRNEDVEVEEDEAENLLKALERELSRRRFGPPVRLEVEETIDPHVLELLIEELDVHQSEVISVPWPLDLTGLGAISNLDRPELQYPPFVPMTSPELSEVETSDAPEILDVMRTRDVLLHHPYDSFSTSVQAFLEEAAEDPNVLAIKQTLYRTSGDSPIVHALIQAAEAGKQVLVLVEIKARFDEQANIRWARKLEQAGCHVVYGVVGLKTHSKLSMVVRQDEDGVLRRYTHIGTGNYHPKTARLYEDLGLLTSNAAVGDDVSKLFNVLTGYALTTDYQRLIVAPHSVRDGLIERIEREMEHAKAGRPARIRFKVNSIVDERTIDALYRASQAGVPIDILVRGTCSITAGVEGLSETIRVRSILGRFLEHSRIYWFENDGEPDVWIGSADLMHRNLDRRVEALVSILAEHHIAYLGRLLDLGFDPQTMSWHLMPDGEWQKVSKDADGNPLNDLQAELIALKRQSRRAPLR